MAMTEPGPGLLIQKDAIYIEISNELLMDMGIIPDTREHKPVPRRTRLRWWLARERIRLAERASRG